MIFSFLNCIPNLFNCFATSICKCVIQVVVLVYLNHSMCIYLEALEYWRPYCKLYAIYSPVSTSNLIVQRTECLIFRGTAFPHKASNIFYNVFQQNKFELQDKQFEYLDAKIQTSRLRSFDCTLFIYFIIDKLYLVCCTFSGSK